jgi:hypothetical protein
LSPSSGRISLEKYLRDYLPHAFTLVSCSAYSLMEAICSSETSIDFNGLHGVITQQIVVFKLEVA